MKNLKGFGMLLLATCLSVILSSCGDDEVDNGIKDVKPIVSTDKTVYELGAVYATLGGELSIEAIPVSYVDVEYGIEVSKKADFSDKKRQVASWNSSNKFRANVYGLSEQTLYYYRAYVTALQESAENYDYYGETLQFTTPKAIDDNNYVDLGLKSKTLWAKTNIGAKMPEEAGDFFAWGEIATKEFYSWENYKWCDGLSTALTKYCTNSNYGTVDNDSILYVVDDVAKAIWGENWCMPTKRQFEELRLNCIWTLTTRNGVSGYEVSGKNGNNNSIFLPFVGRQDGTNKSDDSYGYYWTRSLSMETPYNPTLAWAMFLGSSDYLTYTYPRNVGFSVRPVRVISKQEEE